MAYKPTRVRCSSCHRWLVDVDGRGRIVDTRTAVKVRTLYQHDLAVEHDDGDVDSEFADAVAAFWIAEGNDPTVVACTPLGDLIATLNEQGWRSLGTGVAGPDRGPIVGCQVVCSCGHSSMERSIHP